MKQLIRFFSEFLSLLGILFIFYRLIAFLELLKSIISKAVNSFTK